MTAIDINPVAIIGAGPAGLAAAIQIKRFGVDPLVFEMDAPGGLLCNANLVENYPGFPRGIAGTRLVRLFERQAQAVGVNLTHARVTQLDWDGGAFRLDTSHGARMARRVVVATGTRPRTFTNLEIPAPLIDRVFYEVFHLFGVTGQHIAIVGAGDAAFDYALNLAGRGNTVTILNRGGELKCLPLLWERSQVKPRICYLAHTALETLEPGADDGLLLRCVSGRKKLKIQADYLLGAIGRVPRLDVLSPRVQDQAQSLESRALLYFIGDVKNGIYRQTSIAIGDGIRAAMQICQEYNHGDTEFTESSQ
ncbi:MAG: NAD(P)/FAD-dependent oxidoreductase [Anaerolineae bacterium]|nr:NAD(P)/FAD-dependent oxidoreductase [Anaerolineae bacterium]MBL6966479.1 NAD(P)/FAD-dependent oxidoreductase [Anaerolineales bacterium]